MCICVFDYLSRFVYGSLFLSIRHFFVCLSICLCQSNILFGLFVCLSVCFCASVRCVLDSLYLSVFLFIRHFVRLPFSVRPSFFLSDVLPSVSVFSICHFDCLCLFLRCASCFVHDSPSIYQCIFPFFTLFVCLFVSVVRHFVCLTVRISVSVSLLFVFFWLAACVFTTQL